MLLKLRWWLNISVFYSVSLLITVSRNQGLNYSFHILLFMLLSVWLYIVTMMMNKERLLLLKYKGSTGFTYNRFEVHCLRYWVINLIKIQQSQKLTLIKENKLFRLKVFFLWTKKHFSIIMKYFSFNTRLFSALSCGLDQFFKKIFKCY
jgi:hypothetical protein